MGVFRCKPIFGHPDRQSRRCRQPRRDGAVRPRVAEAESAAVEVQDRTRVQRAHRIALRLRGAITSIRKPFTSALRRVTPFTPGIRPDSSATTPRWIATGKGGPISGRNAALRNRRSDCAVARSTIPDGGNRVTAPDRADRLWNV
ncbi:hypothetical protein WR25_05690 [Diploscapter pachys]|uniref:Uncharacterized protein n=1 Tax=Diploscapter pachys TaxID=2018661 RepID=A0A2A2K2H8_9BILA|nr:hypothetical protein WR25_05690 [Diploscapter pachys]